jgi:hypothetical protein
MLREFDFAVLPTASDVICVKNEIRFTETKIKDLERQLEMLNRHLEMSKAWIAPIRRLNIDILSLIFEMCGEDDWKAPLRIAATSRDWRNLVLATPRAWEFLPVRECQDQKTIKLFIERSDPRPLHLCLPYDYTTSWLSSISQRIECLAFVDFDNDIGSLTFPNVKRLVIASSNNLQISPIDAARFPALRHLFCMDYVANAAPFINGNPLNLPPFIDGDLLNLPPLLSLSLDVSDESYSLSILQACQDTLISLKLTIEETETMMHKVSLVFPWLMCLEITHWIERGRPLEIKTPVLDTYIEYAYEQESGDLMHADLKTITQLRTDRLPESLMLPEVELIQISRKEPREELTLFLHRLSLNPAHFLELETIEVVNDVEAPGDMVELVAAVNRQLEQEISLVFTSDLRDLHGMVDTQLVSFASRSLLGHIADTSPVWSSYAMLFSSEDVTKGICVNARDKWRCGWTIYSLESRGSWRRPTLTRSHNIWEISFLSVDNQSYKHE